MLSAEELSYVHSHLDFLKNLSTKELELVANNIQKVTYQKGYNLYNSENDCLGLLLVESGELRTYILSEDGRDITLYRLQNNDVCILSASCILKNITFDVHIDAEDDTTVYLLNVAAFSKLCSQNVYVENFALKTSVERFSDVMWAMEQILFMRFDKRLAIFLFDEIIKNNTNDITLTQEQIAKYTGSAREVVSRMLKNFQTQGIVELSRGVIHIMNKEKLKELIEPKK
jgi:cAMP-binding proteins - catabolite gene activator and regulatory subunit of cAMP-dependent protein kinases